MATSKKDKLDEVYAVASADFNHGYGHIVIHVYNKLGSAGATIKIACQAGGTDDGRTYGWKHGVWKDYDVLDESTLRTGYWLMRDLTRKLGKLEAESLPPANFAEYALNVLRCLAVKAVYLRPTINSSYGDPTNLPGYSPNRDIDVLSLELRNMEQSIIAAAYRLSA